MAKSTTCEKLMKGGLLSVGLLWAGWMLQLFSGAGDAVVPAWLAWQVGFMVLVPAGLIGLALSTAAAMRQKACMFS